MARSSKDIQLSELKDMISQLNTTIKTLNDTIAKQQSENDNLKAELAWFRQKLFGSSSERRMDDIAGQMSLFDFAAPEEKEEFEVRLPDVPEFEKSELLAFEKETLGIYLSGHPLDEYQIILENKDDIYNLFTMTPYYYKTSKEDTEKLLKLESLTTTVHFAIEIYKKVGF